MSNTIIQVNQELIHNEWKDLVRNSVEETLNALLDHEADQLVDAGKYERSGDRKGYRSGHYQRHFQTTSGEETVISTKKHMNTLKHGVPEHWKENISTSMLMAFP